MRKEPTSVPGESLSSPPAIPGESGVMKRSARFTACLSITDSREAGGDRRRLHGAAEHVVERGPAPVDPYQIAGVVEEGADGGGPAMEAEVQAVPVVEVARNRRAIVGGAEQAAGAG